MESQAKAEIRLTAWPRQRLGSRLSRRLRREGWLPASLYGAVGPYALQVERKAIEQLFRQEGARSRLIRLHVENGAGAEPSGSYPVLIKEVQVDPVTQQLLHVDFYAVPAGKPVRARVAVLLEGIEQLEGRGLVPAVSLREVEVECLPTAIPPYLPLDVSNLQAGERRTAGDLKLPAGVTLLTDTDETLVSAVLPRGAAAGQETPEAAPATPAEPERVTRPRKAQSEDEA